LLSGAAKETLIKSVAQAVPTYSMSYFLLAPDTCKILLLQSQIIGGVVHLIAEVFIGEIGLI
jgi:hypothetical protein